MLLKVLKRGSFEENRDESPDTYELSFDNVKVPKENLLGEKGGGFKIMMIELAKKRLKVALNAICGAEGVIEKTIAY